MIEYGSGQFFNPLISGQVPRVGNSLPAFVALLPISAFRSSKATAAIVHDQTMDCCFLWKDRPEQTNENGRKPQNRMIARTHYPSNAVFHISPVNLPYGSIPVTQLLGLSVISSRVIVLLLMRCHHQQSYLPFFPPLVYSIQLQSHLRSSSFTPEVLVNTIRNISTTTFRPYFGSQSIQAANETGSQPSVDPSS